MISIKNGIAVSDGYAIGRAFVIAGRNDNAVSEFKGVDTEIDRLKTAIENSEKQVEVLKEKLDRKVSGKESAILDSHINILEDPEIVDKSVGYIKKNCCSAEKAVSTVIGKLAEMFKNIKDDEYLKERAADIEDVGSRILRNLSGRKGIDLSDLPKQTVVFAEDLKPSETASLDADNLLALVTQSGGPTSHTAIISKAMGVAAVVGVQGILDAVKTGDNVIVDGFTGKVIVNPDKAAIDEYSKKQEKFNENLSQLYEYLNVKAVTKSGKRIVVAANIANVSETEQALANGAEAVGLFRTEFLYMDREFLPNEEEQFSAYREVAKKMGGKPVTIRTLDIGGDKELPYLPRKKELNPFLGLRAIRICLQKKQIFKTQLRALLRASEYGNIRIMFPMISNLNELLAAKSVLEECKKELISENMPFNHEIEVGMMVEIPSAAIMADEFAKHVDFFSIGTNDLTQYTLAVDRLNESVAGLYNPMDPAVLRLIKNTIAAAHSNGIPCCVCGELASKPKAIPTLLEYGLDEFSMSASSILTAKKIIVSSNNS